MEPRELLTGTRFELEFINSLGNTVGKTYVSQLFEPAKEKEIVIYTPIFESKLVFLSTNTRLRLTFSHPKFGFLCFIAEVTKREYKGKIPVLYLKMVTPFEKIQRRDYYRHECNLNLLYRIHDNLVDNEINEKTPFKKAITKNLSGSGACIVIDERLPDDCSIDIRLSLDDIKTIESICSVLRCNRVDMTKGCIYEVGLHFESISDTDKDRIIKYVYDQQRMQLKKK